MMELQQLRHRINEIDVQIAQLFAQRMQYSALVAQYKYDNDMRIRDEERNMEIKSNAASGADADLVPYVYRLYDEILNISRDYQREVMIRTDKQTAPPQEHHSL